MQRTAKLQGNVIPDSPDAAVSADIYFNNVLVYSGVLENVNSTTQHDFSTVATWDFSADLHGAVPVSIVVHNGAFTFVDIFMNYIGDVISQPVINHDAVWPLYVPKSIDILASDRNTLSDDQFYDKYQLNKKELKNNVTLSTVELTSDLNFGWVNKNTAESDGKDSVTINGVPRVRILLDPNQTGDWHYTVHNGERLDCIFTIQPPIFSNS